MISKGMLSDYFDGVVAKRLSAVETDLSISHQHEFNGTDAFKRVFGLERQTYQATFLFLADDEERTDSASATMTWYDAREDHPTRSEFRFYFTTNFIPQLASEGDLLVVARKRDDTLIVIVAVAGSTSESQLLWLFGIDDIEGTEDFYRDLTAQETEAIGVAASLILERLGIEVPAADDSFLDRILKQFGGSFPTTAEMSAYARSTVTGVDPVGDPDGAIMAWWQREELLFRTLERHLLEQRLEQGFAGDVDGFISFSLSVQNRRKSRAGRAFEHHVEQAFKDNRVKYSRGASTENGAFPDFLFPGIAEYEDLSFPVTDLAMLAVKSSCKDRWRQVLSEANRIAGKHLLTLEPGVSEQQTREMKANSLRLVVPLVIQQTYTAGQRAEIMSFAQFVGFVRQQQ